MTLVRLCTTPTSSDMLKASTRAPEMPCALMSFFALSSSIVDTSMPSSIGSLLAAKVGGAAPPAACPAAPPSVAGAAAAGASGSSTPLHLPVRERIGGGIAPPFSRSKASTAMSNHSRALSGWSLSSTISMSLMKVNSVFCTIVWSFTPLRCSARCSLRTVSPVAMTHTPLSSRNTNRHGRALRRRVRESLTREAPAVGFVKQIPQSNIGPLRKVMARRLNRADGHVATPAGMCPVQLSVTRRGG